MGHHGTSPAEINFPAAPISSNDFSFHIKRDSPESYMEGVGYAKVKYITRLAIINTLSVLAAMLLPGCNSAKPETIVPVMDITVTAPAEVTAVTITSTIEAGAWNNYQNPQAGYSAEYPADWVVSEQVSEDGTMVTTFSSPNGNAGIVVMVQRAEFDGTGNSDIPNTRCEEVKIGDLTGMQCFDTINAATSTTVAANGKTFTIAALGKHLDENLYSRFLSGLQIRS